MNLAKLCEEYIINIYTTAHEKNVDAMLGLSLERRDIHDQILHKMKAEREDGVLKITNNLNWLSCSNGDSFDIYKYHTKQELLKISRKLRISLEMYCAKKYPTQTLIECNTDKLDNFTIGNTYLAVRNYNDIIEVYDDDGEIYEVDKELQLELEDMSIGDFSYCYIGEIG